MLCNIKLPDVKNLKHTANYMKWQGSMVTDRSTAVD